MNALTVKQGNKETSTFIINEESESSSPWFGKRILENSWEIPGKLTVNSKLCSNIVN